MASPVRKKPASSRRRTRKSHKLPLIGGALLCERVLLEKDDVPSVIRITNKLVIGAQEASPPKRMPRGVARLFVYLIIRGGDAPGRHTIRLRLKHPDGQTGTPGVRLPVVLDSPIHEARLTIEANLQLRVQGVHWLDVLCDGARLTSIPFEVEYRPNVDLPTPRT